MVRHKLAGLAKDTALYGSGRLAGRLAALVMLPILSRIFTPADYGAIDLLNSTFAFVLIFLKLGVPSGLQRFYFRLDGDARRRMVSSCVALLSVGAALGATVFIVSSHALIDLFSEEVPGLHRGFVILALCLPVEMFWENQILLLRLARRPKLFAAANVSRVLVLPLLTYLLVVHGGLAIDGVFLARLITALLLVATIAVVNRGEFTAAISLSEFRRVLAFGAPGHPGLILRASMTLLPRYLLAAFAPLAAVGLFGIAFRLCTVVKFLVESFNLAWNPFAYQNEGAPDERRIYELSFKGLFGAIAITGFTLSVFAGEVLAILAPAEYAGARLLVPGLALYMGVEGLTLILSTVLYTRSMVRWASYLNGVRVVVFLAVAVPLIRLHEAAGLVVALDLSVLVYLIWYLHKARQGLMFRVPWRRMVAVGLGAVGLIVALETVAMGEVATIAVKLSVSLLFGAVVVTTLFSRRERSVAQGAIRRFVGGGLGRA